MATVVTAVLQDSVAVATVPLGRPPAEFRIQAGSGCVGRPPQHDDNDDDEDDDASTIKIVHRLMR